LAFATLGFAVVLNTDFDEVKMFENGLFLEQFVTLPFFSYNFLPDPFFNPIIRFSQNGKGK
jgi:hypothetical protein